jgi:gluconokinase
MYSESTDLKVIVLMGVSGCGKTTVGANLACELGWEFFDGDDYHSPENVEKMSKGIPLSDVDRFPWLEVLRGLMCRSVYSGQSVVMACSILKQTYRDHLMVGCPDYALVYLRGDYDLILKRMRERQKHYMKASMLKSQFEILEEPEDAITVDINQDAAAIVYQIIRELGLRTGSKK